MTPLAAAARATPLSPTEITLAGGQLVDLLEIRDDLDFVGLAEMLAKAPRFAGASMGNPYSVAQHSCLVAQMVAGRAPDDPHLILEGLIHDAAEALIGDRVTPMKAALDHFGGLAAWTDLERHVMQSVYASLGLRPLMQDRSTPPVVRAADAIALATEWRDLMVGPCPTTAPPAAIRRIHPLPWPAAQAAWLTALRHQAEALCLNAPGITTLMDRDL